MSPARPIAIAVLVALLSCPPAPASGRQAPPRPVSLTLDEAIQVALVSNHALRSLRLDVEDAREKIREGWGTLLPQVDLMSTYTRNVESVNPFSGSSAGGLFESLGFLDWLAYNEDARTDTDPGTNPISVAEYFIRRQAGLDAAGVPPTDPSANPFRIPSTYRTGLSVTQTLFDGRAIFGAKGAQRWLGPMSEAAVTREEQTLVDQVRRAFYGTMLAVERTMVVTQSVQRADRTRQEVSRQVSEGVAPVFQRLSAEVELANLETQQVQSQNDAEAALDGLRLLLGIPADQPVRLVGSLEADNTIPASPDSAGAVIQALTRRPDLDQARINIELQRVQLQVNRSTLLPDLSAFANLSYIGNVPDNRMDVISDPNDPFRFTTRTNGYFSDQYWDWDFNVGFQLRWTLFNGFQRKHQNQQLKIALDKARISHDFLEQSIATEVVRALRDVRAARRRMISQERNVQRAALNYEHAEARLKEGVATPIEVREASSQLDQSRLNHLQAIHDFLVARSAYETAVGTPVSTATVN